MSYYKKPNTTGDFTNIIPETDPLMDILDMLADIQEKLREIIFLLDRIIDRLGENTGE